MVGVRFAGQTHCVVNSVTWELEAFRSETVLNPLLAAQEAVSRLDERARRSAHRASWMQRLLFHEACACQLMDGDLVHLEDLVLLDGDAFSGAPSMALSSALEVLKIWRAAEAGDAASALRAARPGLAGAAPLRDSGEASELGGPALNGAHLQAWRRIEAESRKQPPLIAAAMVWDAWLELLPESRSSWRAPLLAALTLKSRGLTPNLLLPLDIGWRVSKYRRRPGEDLAVRIAGFLGWAEAAAEEGQKEFDSLVLAEKLLRSSLRGRRSSSRMPALVDLLLKRPFVSVASAAKALRVSRQGAHAMLEQLGAPAHNPRDGPRDKQPRRDLADGIAGGIAKAAEIVGNIMEGFLSPETPQEKAAREALARVIAETAPEREAAEAQRELDNRQAAYEQQKSAQEKFDAYFARHGDRLRREEEERQRKAKDRDR
jgi:hypothetical protein